MTSRTGGAYLTMGTYTHVRTVFLTEVYVPIVRYVPIGPLNYL